ncbi:MAG TPA: TylF/MycF/NovP-related O-methyltransferase [Dongiaceae bacterium]|nr:TylF/MycF/NovP-related O-methyltransferase [Dongiaceae bacterium]
MGSQPRSGIDAENYLTFFPDIPDETRGGRNVREGYARGWGLQFGDLRHKVKRDPLFREAHAAAAHRTILSDDNLKNLFLIMRFFLGRLPAGDIVEFGSFRGGTAIFMAVVARHLYPETKVYSLDTFEGMPETDSAIDAHEKGDFGGVDLRGLRSHARSLGLGNLTFVKGLFQDTAPHLLARVRHLRLCHIDCDIASAVRYSYRACRAFMVPGGYIVFDDATTSSCIGATAVVEDDVIRRDGLNSEQIFPHFVFRAHGFPRPGRR